MMKNYYQFFSVCPKDFGWGLGSHMGTIRQPSCQEWRPVSRPFAFWGDCFPIPVSGRSRQRWLSISQGSTSPLPSRFRSECPENILRPIALLADDSDIQSCTIGYSHHAHDALVCTESFRSFRIKARSASMVCIESDGMWKLYSPEFRNLSSQHISKAQEACGIFRLSVGLVTRVELHGGPRCSKEVSHVD